MVCPWSFRSWLNLSSFLHITYMLIFLHHINCYYNDIFKSMYTRPLLVYFFNIFLLLLQIIVLLLTITQLSKRHLVLPYPLMTLRNMPLCMWPPMSQEREGEEDKSMWLDLPLYKLWQMLEKWEKLWQILPLSAHNKMVEENFLLTCVRRPLDFFSSSGKKGGRGNLRCFGSQFSSLFVPLPLLCLKYKNIFVNHFVNC